MLFHIIFVLPVVYSIYVPKAPEVCTDTRCDIRRSLSIIRIRIRLRVSDYQSIRGHRSIRVYNYPSIRVSDYASRVSADIGVSERPSIQLSNYPIIRVSEYPSMHSSFRPDPTYPRRKTFIRVIRADLCYVLYLWPVGISISTNTTFSIT